MVGSRLVLAAILGASGCSVVFPLEAPDAGAPDTLPDPPYDRCAPAFDDPGIRYAVVENPRLIEAGREREPAPWSWEDARAACQARGMDLAVFNDDREAGQVHTDSWPYWIGQTVDPSGWAAIDGCAPYFGAGARTSPTAQCGTTTSALEITSVPCDGAVTPVGPITRALCETPRPVIAECLPGRASSYTISPGPLTFEAAVRFCTGLDGHVAVIESLDELHAIAELTTERRLWLGTTFDGARWVTETRCPAVYSWTHGAPSFRAGETCAATVLVRDDPGGLARVDGMAVTSCADGAVHALCELR